MTYGRAAIAAFVLLLTSTSAFAVPITGVLNFTGAVRVTDTEIDFLPPAGSDGDIQVSGAVVQQGSFVSIANTSGTILDLDRTLYPVGPVTPALQGFLMLSNNIRFDLNRILPGSFSSVDCGAPAAAGQSCTPPPIVGLGISPFNLTNQTATSSTAAFQVEGVFVNTLTQEESFGTGLITAQFSNRSLQDVLSELQTQGVVQTSFSAEFNAPIPEPSAWALGALGLILIGARKLRRR